MTDSSGPEEAPRSEIGRRSVSAVLWGATSTVARYALQLLAQVVLARMLGPDIYGLFGLGLVIFTFSRFIGAFGFGWALMQLKELTDRDVRFAFTWQFMAGCVAAVVLLLSSGLLADFFREPQVESVVQWLALACIIDAAGSASSHLLRRRLDFRSLGIVDVAGYFVGYIMVGIPAALLGAGVWALVAAWLVQAGVKTLGYYAVARHDLRPLFRHPEGGKIIMGMGATVFITNIVNWLLFNIDRVVLGRVLDVRIVGWYTVALNLASTPNSLLIGSLQPAFFAAAARVQDEPERIRGAYREVVASILILISPLFAFLAAVAPDVVLFLYGEEWVPAGDILRILALGMPAFIFWALSTPVLWNTGKKHYEALLQAPLIPVMVGGLYVAASFGPNAVAAAVSLMFMLRALVIGVAAMRAVDLSLWALRGDLFRSLFLNLLVVAMAYLGILTTRGSGPLTALIAASTVTSLAVAVLLLARPSVLGPQAQKMLARFLPDWLTARLGFETEPPPPGTEDG